MRCPKCQYISYESGDRCRNCGYEFSLSVAAPDLDLPIKTGDEAVGPFADFSLDSQPGSTHTPSDKTNSGRATPASGELPLFRAGADGGQAPLVALPPAPRPPVSVRKSSVVPRLAPRRRDEPALDLDFVGAEAGEQSSEAAPMVAPRPSPKPAEPAAVAGAGMRLLAAIADLLLIGAIDATVLYLTLKLTGVAFSEVRILPIVPFLAFLGILNGGYLVVFTVAGGQTIGKMVAGIKVVTGDESAATDRVPLAQAVMRTVGMLASLLTLGIGWIVGLVSADRRALHDRIAHTRVVRA